MIDSSHLVYYETMKTFKSQLNFVAFSQYLNFKPHVREAYGELYVGPCAPLKSDIYPDFPKGQLNSE